MRVNLEVLLGIEDKEPEPAIAGNLARLHWKGRWDRTPTKPQNLAPTPVLPARCTGSKVGSELMRTAKQ